MRLGRSSRGPLRAGGLSAAAAGALMIGVLGAVPSHASPTLEPGAPHYEMPFPCGQQWTGTTRSSHRPSQMSIDFNRPGDLGDLLVSAAPGVVTRVADTGSTSYGRYVVVDHGDGHSTLYAHLKSVWTTLGQQVDQGSVIGLVGESGGVTGAHLHFEERLDNSVQQPAFHGAAFLFGTTGASANCPDVPLAGDWDNDQIDEVAVFRRASAGGVFRLARPDGTVEAIRFGRGSDAPVAGDWNGDGQTDVGVRRPGRSTFLLRGADGTSTSLRLGRRTDVPVTGDWNGDRITDVGVWRPGVATFHLLLAPGVVQTVPLGSVGSQPVTGDWNGDGSTDLGVFDPASATFTLRITGADGTAWYTTLTFGAGSDIPVTGDWNGDGVTDVGTWTPSTATYSLRTAPTTGRSTATVTTQRFGRAR